MSSELPSDVIVVSAMGKNGKEKCYRCNRVRNDVELRSCEDRLCKECNDYNSACLKHKVRPDWESVSAGVYPPVPPTRETRSSGANITNGSSDETLVKVIDNHSRPSGNSPTNSVNNEDEEGSSEDSDIVCNELLCYLYNKMDVMTHDLMVKVCTEFYSSVCIEQAKNILYNRNAVMNELGLQKRRRQGPGKDKSNMEDILNALHKCYSKLPTFVAKDLSQVPPLDMNNVDFSFIMIELKKMRSELATVCEEMKVLKADSVATVSQSPSTEQAANKSYASAARPRDTAPKRQGGPERTGGESQVKSAASFTPAPVTTIPVELAHSSIRCPPASVANSRESVSDTFQVVSHRRKANKPQAVIGTSTECSQLKVNPKRPLSVFISRLDPQTKTESIVSYVKNVFKMCAKCEKLHTRYDTYASFRVEVMNDKASELFDPAKWPSGVYLRKFFKPRS